MIRPVPMHYLIDGYNLLHALGRLQTRTGLEKARLRLLSRLHTAFGNESVHVTVVFDAAHPPPGATKSRIITASRFALPFPTTRPTT